VHNRVCWSAFVKGAGGKAVWGGEKKDDWYKQFSTEKRENI